MATEPATGAAPPQAAPTPDAAAPASIPTAATAATTPVPPAAATVAQPAATPAPAASRSFSGMPAQPGKTTALAMQPAHAAPPSAAGTIGGTLFALALVLGLIFGLAWLARRMPGLAGVRGTSRLRLVASLPLGTRERLLVVEVGNQQLLLGTGAAGTRLLHTLETPLPEPPPAPPAPFAQMLAQHFGKKA